MLFRDVIGQEAIKKKLTETIRNNRLGHAWMFFGPEGSGKLPLAIAFARYISCQNPKGSDSCDTCSSCTKYSKLIHPDLHFSFPVNKTKTVNKDTVVCDDFMEKWRNFLTVRPYGGLTQWYESIDLENKQGIINTEESKRIAYKLNLKPYESDYKTVIIWQADRMHDQAANKLLKLLEEPPPHTFFILVSEKPDQILPTIRSRCIHLKIPRIDDSVIQEVLVRKHGLDKQKAGSISRVAAGNFQKALNLIQEPEDYHECFIRFRDLMRTCYQKKIPEMVKITDELASLNREKQKLFLEYSLGMLRESLVMHYNKTDIVYLSDEEYQFTSNFFPYITAENIMQFKEELTRAISDIERNANGKFVFLDVALTFSDLLKRK